MGPTEKGYQFVSYSHKDKKQVQKEIRAREARGGSFWYDSAIQAGSDWAGDIGTHLANAESVLYFASKNADRSENCRRELAFAKEHGIPVETVRVRPGRKGLAVTGIILALLLALIACGVAFFSGEVPDTTGLDADEGVRQIEANGFTCTRDYRYSDSGAFGTVIGQSRKGRSLILFPVTVTESLGPERDLTEMPDTIGLPVADGIRKLVDAGFSSFTLAAGSSDGQTAGTVTEQYAPAGYRVARTVTPVLTVADPDGTLEVEFDGVIYPISEEPVRVEIGRDPSDPDALTDAERKLFLENSSHGITPFTPVPFEAEWMPATSQRVILESTTASYGWVAVRDMTLDASQLFASYSELYVCPGIRVTVRGNVTEHPERYNDFYVAPGGTLIFEDEVSGGLYLVNDGDAVFRKNLSGGPEGILVVNRGNVEVAGEIGSNAEIWSFYGSSLAGDDQSGGGIHDYSAYRQIDAKNWYEGCAGENGVWETIIKMRVYAAYDWNLFSGWNGDGCPIAPVIKPEDYEDHIAENGYTDAYLFLSDYTVKGSATGTGPHCQFIAAPFSTLTIEDPTPFAGLIAEHDAKIVINTDLIGHDPYTPYLVNDGEMVLNGNYIRDGGSTAIRIYNRGSLTVNGKLGGGNSGGFNMPGAAIDGEIIEGTVILDLDYDPGYVTYGNAEISAIGFRRDNLGRDPFDMQN